MTLRSTLMLAGALLAGVASQAGATTPNFPSQGNIPANANPQYQDTTAANNTLTGTGTAIFGGGASLPAPYLRQAGDCWAEKIDLAFIDKTATQSLADFVYTGTPTFNCATAIVAPGNVVSYISTGSGRGILGWFAHTGYYNNDPTGPNATATTYDSWLSTLAAGSGIAPAVYATKVNFAASEAGLPQTDPTVKNGVPNSGGDIDTYNGTKVDGSNNSIGATVNQSGQRIAIQSFTGVSAPTAGLTGAGYQFPNPLKTYGRAIQIPLLIAVPTIAFDPIYKKVYNPSNPAMPITTSYKNSASGKVRLSNLQLCNILNGVDTNFGQDGLATTFGLQTADLPNASAIGIQIVGRSDGSGTTAIVYRHLAKVCPALIGAANKFVPDAFGNVSLKVPSTLNGPTYAKGQPISNPPAGETLGLFTRADGNDGVAEYIDFSRLPNDAASNTLGQNTIYQSRVGYVGNDYVTPYVSTQQNNYLLISASLQNKLGAYVAATPAAAAIAFGTGVNTLLPPQTLTTGKFSATAGGMRSDPATHPDPVKYADPTTDPANLHTWVSAANVSSPLADPAATGAYPLVGTTNGLFYQCYANSAETAVIKNFLSWFYGNKITTDTSKGILAKNGLAPLTKPYLTALTETFIVNPTYPGTGKLNLDFGSVGDPFSTNECGSVTVGA